MSSSTAFDQSCEQQFRDIFIGHHKLGSVAKHFCPSESYLCPPALHPKSSSRVEVTAYARICMSVCLLGHQQSQLIVTMRARPT